LAFEGQVADLVDDELKCPGFGGGLVVPVAGAAGSDLQVLRA
jgi:hypothetical protein